MLITKNSDLNSLPMDVRDRIQFLLNNVDYMPIYIANIDIDKAEFINKYSEGYVEVFILYNNESGAHYFFRDEETFLKILWIDLKMIFYNLLIVKGILFHFMFVQKTLRFFC